MSTLSSSLAVTDPAEDALDDSIDRLLPSDAELLVTHNFVSGLHPKADSQAQVYYHGEYMSYAQACEREKADFLTRVKKAILENRRAQQRARAAAAERARQQAVFCQNAARGHYRKELALALPKYQEASQRVAHTKEKLVRAQSERTNLERDTTTEIAPSARALAANTDLLAVLAPRLAAYQEEAGACKSALNGAVKDAQAELIYTWQSAREPLLKKVAQAVRTLFDLSDFDASDLVGRSHLLYGLDYAAGFPKGHVEGNASWPYSDDPIVLAEDVERRSRALTTYLAGPTHIHHLEIINRVT